jgi:hypothetical protein
VSGGAAPRRVPDWGHARVGLGSRTCRFVAVPASSLSLYRSRVDRGGSNVRHATTIAVTRLLLR